MATCQLVRHATLLVDIADRTLLVDPMLGDPGVDPPIQNSPNEKRNPLLPLPDVSLDYDAVLVTHRHNDHFDDAAREALSPGVPLYCQPEEADAFREEGFSDVRPIDEERAFGEGTITRVPARHGHGSLAQAMAPVAGFVIDADTRLYLAGDTVWYDAVARTLATHDPDAVVVNAGAAQFTEGKPITMDAEDVDAVRDHTDGQVIAVHMDAINHCLLTRADLREAVDDVVVPEDGDRVDI
ncbi:MBL fold metallo-hydrolase [Natronomonas sp. EA1]|uniref:MBL fold metallo-hydrolase n=1 Tax=Natronomonas sp. EA1 TaxID=3421655 RepID=UPI003EB898C8